MRSASELVRELAALPDRGAGREGERRAATLLAAEITETGRRTARIETFWCRPDWPLAQAWHLALAIAGSLVSTGSPRLGAGMLAVSLLSILADWSLALSPGRRLSFERASQNVVSPVLEGTEGKPVRLVLTANIDAGRAGLVHRHALRGTVSSLNAALHGRAPGWLAWTALFVTAALLSALLRIEGHPGLGVSLLQLAATVGLGLELALLVELATAPVSPGATDNASGVALALALARALDAAPPTNLSVELVLSGAGDSQGLGLRRHLRAHRASHRQTNTVVIGLGPCGDGSPRWLRSDGPLLPLGYLRELQRLCAEVAAGDPDPGFAAARGRGCSPALPARMRRLPAITLTCLDADGRIPRSHRPDDDAAALRIQSLDSTRRVALELIDAIDAYIATRNPPPP
jgi:hypothetical protein